MLNKKIRITSCELRAASCSHQKSISFRSINNNIRTLLQSLDGGFMQLFVGRMCKLSTTIKRNTGTVKQTNLLIVYFLNEIN